jgi:uncharacterized protein (UPF0335 family)
MARNIADNTQPKRRGRPRKTDNGIGHNSPPAEAGGYVDSSALNGYVNRLLGLHSDRAEINADIKEVYGEAKEAGFVTKILRRVIAEKLLEDNDREQQYALMDAYRSALGMLADLPLGQAALASETTLRAAREHLGTADDPWPSKYIISDSISTTDV